MTNIQISEQRLHNQSIHAPTFKTPGDIVSWLGAVQAQDYLGALWAIGLRMNQSTEACIEKAIADKAIVRSWPMRNTLHFVAPKDLRWMLKLLGPRMISRRALHYRQAELDKTIFTKSGKLFVRALEGGNHLTRPEMYELLERAKISTTDQRGLHILAHLSQEGLLCFGPRKGKQHAFTLLEEWLPASRILDRDVALAELALRYFTGHGPATLQDFTWWSGLAATDARTALEMIKPKLVRDVVKDNTYWTKEIPSIRRTIAKSAFLLPAYDEYTVGYKDRSAMLDPAHSQQARNGIFNPVVVVDGQIVGTWQRTFKKGTAHIEITSFGSKSISKLVRVPFERYGSFIGMAAVRS